MFRTIATCLLFTFCIILMACTSSNKTKFFRATSDGDVATMKQAINEGADVNARGVGGLTPLMQSAGNGNNEAVLTLLENGANIDAQSDFGFTALCLAARWGQSNTVKLLLDEGASIDTQTIHGLTALTIAVLQSHEDTARILVERGANLELLGAADKDSKANKATALMYAARDNNTAIVNLLLKGGANVSTTDTQGLNALMFAVVTNHTQPLKLLLNAGADVNYMSPADNDYTALMFAVMTKNIQSAQTLLENGARLDIARHNGDTAMSLAHKTDNGEMIDLLKQYGAK